LSAFGLPISKRFFIKASFYQSAFLSKRLFIKAPFYQSAFLSKRLSHPSALLSKQGFQHC
jgi:hypothetical protein